MNPPKTTRRTFLYLTGGVLGACICSCAGLSVFPGSEPVSTSSLPVGFPEFTLGDRAAKKVLVAYASVTGSTGGAAEIVARTLAGQGAAVEVHPLQNVASLAGFDAVVLGSAIRGSKWLPEASTFLQANREQLSKVPTAFFTVCLTMAYKSGAAQAKVSEWLASERALLPPVAEGYFAGSLFLDRVPLLMRAPFRVGLVAMGLPWNGGDFRSPTAIRAWAASLPSLLN